MISPGGTLWKHYKGNKYLVVGTFRGLGLSREIVKENQKIEIRTSTNGLAVYPRTGPKLVDAYYTGSKTVIEGDEPLVLYVGCYDNPHGNRFCVRPASEWRESVPLTSGSYRVQRYSPLDPE